MLGSLPTWRVRVVASDRRFARSAPSLAARSAQKPACFPNRSQTFVVRNGVLNNERLYSVRMNQDHAKTHGAAVILHVKRVAREPKSFGEVIHGFGDVIERVRKFFRVWPVTVSEAGVIGRDKMVVIGKLGEEGLEHPRGRREPVEQEQDRRVFRTSFSVKDGEPVYVYRAIKSRVFHG